MARPQVHIVTLTQAEREQLTSIAGNFRYSRLERNRAQILLLTSQGETDISIAQKVGCTHVTARNVRLRWVRANSSPEAISTRKRVLRAEQRNRRKRVFDGEKEAKLIAITCSTPPEGASRWTLQLLQDQVIEMGILEKVGKETIRRTLKKTNLSRG